ncbi:hypothetical protein E4U60_001443 [Claviceps pazoutovae]|uniref:Uncharacterized protein n=1 Tax=Claviceps pazoutovae TaxID=1649127 RepID=A0A9P7MCM3_9HYPO|nr:hypothetical protein E4U60_001443 [Claviceps pazoutovae]
MSTQLAALEEQWLTKAFHHLLQLVDTTDIDITRRDCGFDQVIQRKLRDFDSNRTIDAARDGHLVEAAPASTPPPLCGNVRGKLVEAREIFRAPDDGGLQFDEAFRGLEVLEEVEIHRQRLVKATRTELGRISGHERHHSAQVVEQLDTQATEHYKACQLGFRAMCLMSVLRPSGPVSQHEAAKVMARLNTLFPPDFADYGTEPRTRTSFGDRDLMPCTPGLRESIRFYVYGHLMSGGSDTAFQGQDSQSFEERFLSRCSIPTYQEARQKLMSYTGEARKMEMTCLAILHAIELRSPSTHTGHDSRPVTPSSISFNLNRSKSPEATSATPSSSITSACQHASSETSTIADMSITSVRSSAYTTSVHSLPNTTLPPLLKGMPGRELSPAKTDGAAFAMDFSAPDVLAYPRDLSQTEYHIHPLAVHSGLSDTEMAELGLKIPKTRSNRDI